MCGAHAEQTALYLTETSSSVESVPDAANNQVPTPKPNTPGPAPSPNIPAPKPNTSDPAPNTPATVSNTPAPDIAQNTSPDVAANIGALLNPGSLPNQAQASPIQPGVPQSTAGTRGAPTQPASSPVAKISSPSSPSPAAVVIVGSSSIVANSDSMYVIGGQSLSAGGVVIAGGTSITLGSAGQVAVVGGATQQVQTVSVPPNTAAPPAPVISVGGQAITANSNSVFVLAGQTIAPGSGVVIAGTTISILSSGGGIIVDGVTQPFQAGAPSAATPVLNLNGQTYAANSQSAYVIAGQTLSAGKPIVVSGTTIALASTGGVAVINSVPQTIASSSRAAGLTINGQTITANLQSSYVISGQTLVPGHPITIGTGSSATILSLATDSAGHTVVVVNGKTYTLASGGPLTGAGNNSTTTKTSSSSTNGVGDYIASGIGFSSVGTSKPTSMATTAGADINGPEMSTLFFSSLLGIVGVMRWI